MASPFNFLPELILRSPLLSYRAYHPTRLDGLLQHNWFKLTIYLASASFYERLAVNNFSASLLTPKERVTLLKYYNRMSFRPTPFGAFSSFSCLTWGDGTTNLLLCEPEEAHLKLLIDQDVIAAISNLALEDHTANSVFFSNPTLYKTNKEFRYIKTLRDEDTGKASYILESFDANKFTKHLLSSLKQQPESYTNIIAYIKAGTGCTENDAIEYLGFLIRQQILMPKDGITILGDDHLNNLFQKKPFFAPQDRQTLKDLLARMKVCNVADMDNIMALTNQFTQILLKHGIKRPKQLFYANMERPLHYMVNTKHQQQLSEALHCLRLLSLAGQPPMLTEFIKQFKARFELQKVPLLQALDPETGIAYGALSGMTIESSLLKDMYVDQQETQTNKVQWSAVHRLLFHKWNSSMDPAKGIVINEHDLDSLHNPAPQPMPPSMPVMFRLYDENIFIEAAGGTSAINLIGRFTLLSTHAKAIADKIALHEQQANPDVIFAEVNLVSDNHVDNINRRLPVYEYEIAINTPHTLGKEKQVRLDDLYLSVVDDELVMESASIKKRVIPRLSSAYNYQNHQLNLFRFLGDLQHYGIQSGFTLDLEALFPGMPFYPRVVYQQSILCLAKWYIFEHEIKSLTAGETIPKVKRFRTEKGWPQYIALGRTDQQLIFNIEDEAQIQLFVDCIKTEQQVKITEHLMPYADCITDKNGKQMVNQFVAIVLSADKAYRPLPPRVKSQAAKPVREFITGSKWIYFKIYCSPARANDLLVKKILPVLNSLKQAEAECWFFIRYIDTAPHIRLRICVKQEFLGNVLIALKTKLAADVRYQLIQEYKAEVYRRELERYGADIMENVEKVFEASSNLIIRYLRQTYNATFNFTYHSLAIVSVSEIINMFFADTEGRIAFTWQIAQALSREHKDIKALKFSLDKKYRSLKDEITALLSNKELYYKKLKLTGLNLKFKESISNINLSEHFTTQRKIQLAADIIHMHLNRLFADEQRYQELIIYHCLHKHLKAVFATSVKNVY